MEENTRSARRTRNRPPYDLRRKVLLKNFLREQMTIVPESTSSTNTEDSENLDPASIQSSSEAINVDIENLDRPVDNDEASNIEPPSASQEKDSETSEDGEQNRGIEHHPNSPWKSTLVFDFTKITDLKVSRLIPVKRKSTPLSPEDIKLITKKTKVKQKNAEKCKIIKSSTPIKRKWDFSKFTSLKPNKASLQIKHKSLSKSKSGIVKAKHVLKASKAQSKPVVIDANKTPQEQSLDGLKVRIRKVITMIQDLMKRDREEVAQFEKDFGPVDSNSEDASDSTVISSDGDITPRQLDKDWVQKVSESAILAQQNQLDTLIKVERSLWRDIGRHFPSFRKKSDVEADKKENGSTSLCEATSKRASDTRSAWVKKSKSCTVSTQCIPEDMNWSLHEIRKLERVNQRLREENKLLSESLSSIMADVDVAFNPYLTQNQKPSSVGRNRSRNSAPSSFDRRYPIVSAPSTPQWSGNDSNTFNFEQRTKSAEPSRFPVLRSRSVLERAERRREIRLRLSSKSMCHRPYVRISPRTLYKAQPCIITSCSSSEEFPLSNIHLPPTLSTRVDQSNFKTTLNRRSSMPEKSQRRPVPTRRSSCAFDNKSSYYKSFLSLPKEAFY